MLATDIFVVRSQTLLTATRLLTDLFVLCEICIFKSLCCGHHHRVNSSSNDFVSEQDAPPLEEIGVSLGLQFVRVSLWLGFFASIVLFWLTLVFFVIRLF